MAQALAKDAESKIHEAGSLAVAESLIPALASFIHSLSKAAGFFQVMEEGLQLFSEKAEASLDAPKKLHFIKMKSKAKEIKSMCLALHAVLPEVRTDFMAIPNEGTDQNYVDRWLAKQLEIIKEKNSSSVLKIVLKAFSPAENEDD